MSDKKWELSWPSDYEGHVIPLHDTIAHYQHESCACKPKIEFEGRTKLVIHNSYDRREYAEQPALVA